MENLVDANFPRLSIFWGIFLPVIWDHHFGFECVQRTESGQSIRYLGRFNVTALRSNPSRRNYSTSPNCAFQMEFSLCISLAAANSAAAAATYTWVTADFSLSLYALSSRIQLEE